MSNQRKKQVLAFCRKQCIGIVEDDAYSGLAFDEKTNILPIKKFDVSNQVVYLGSLSKYIGRNIRIGWMIAPREIIEKLANIRHHIDSGLSILPQLLAEEYLSHHYQTHQTWLRQQLQKKANQLMDWLDDYFNGDVIYRVPTGGFHLYAHLPVNNAAQELTILNQLLSKHIIVSQGTDFGDKVGSIRLSYGHFEKNLL